MTAVVRAERLTKLYGSRPGLLELDLEVEPGEVFGFLGPNGAGKTTTIRLLLDMIRPSSGRAFVFGIETTADPVAIHARTGYLPGEFGLYDRFSGGETIEYFANLRGNVDRAYQRALVERLDLDPSRRYREYSKGNKQKVALVIALQHRPDLLVLDEPTTGLDPLVQQEFLGLIGEAKAEGRTVFLSSHVIGEVERSCDRVAIVRAGRLVAVDRVEALKDLSAHRLELRFRGPVRAADFETMANASDVVVDGTLVRLRVAGSVAPVLRAALDLGLEGVTSHEPSLEDAFLAAYGRGAGRERDEEAADVR